jgi:Ca2+-binding RTX toxin-like protein
METLDGGLGNDTFHIDADDDVIFDAGGIDRLVVHNMSWTLGAGFENLTIANDESESGYTGIGNGLDNHIEATWAGSRLEGRDGDDTLVGASGQGAGNELLGGAGDDSLISGGLDDRLDGGIGVDTLIGLGAEIGDGEDFVFSAPPGAANADVIVNFDQFSRIVLDGTVMPQIGPSGTFAAGDARFVANPTGVAQDGSDRIVYNTSNGQLWYDADGSGADAAQLIATLQGLEANDIVVENGTEPPPDGQVINGTSGHDTLADTPGNDTINGLAGNDTINGGHGGTDVVNGGDGRDSLQFMTATSAVVVDFVAGTAGATSFTNIERVVTGDFNDQLTGNAAAQNLTARSGSDTLWGAGGVDTLWGGAGPDTFIFREMGTSNADVIGDWASGSDEIALDNAAMSALGADGAFVAADARFWASSTGTAHDANDRVVYNSTTGSLYYDADGSGAGASQLIATLTGHPAVAATDIVVI